MRRRPVDHNETLDPGENRHAATLARPALVSWEAAIREAESELKNARHLVEALEALIGDLRWQMQTGKPWPGTNSPGGGA